MTPFDVAMSCTAVCFGRTVRDVLGDSEWGDVPARLDVLELWSGVGSIFKAAVASGHAGEGIDILGPHGVDLSTQEGFQYALRRVMSLKPGGLLWMAPVCSSFIWLSRSQTKRKLTNVMGDPGSASACMGNLFAQQCAFFLAVAYARGVHVAIENPGGSMIFTCMSEHLSKYPVLQQAMVYRCTYSTERLGDRLFKPYKMVATGSWVQRLVRKCKCPSHQSMVDEDEEGKKTGKADMLQLSAAYPPQLGTAVVDAWAAHSEHIEPHKSIPDAPDKFRARMSHVIPDPGISAHDLEFASVVPDGANKRKCRTDTAPAKPRKKKEGVPDVGDPWSSVLEGKGGEVEALDADRGSESRVPGAKPQYTESMGEIHDLWAKVAAPPPRGRGRRSTKAKARLKNIDTGDSVDDPWANVSQG
jgi:hypothetical protein